MVVTNKRLLATAGGDRSWQEWFYRPGLALARYDHGGIGSLELLDTNSLLAHWRYTLGLDTAVVRLIESFNLQLNHQLTGEVPPVPAQVFCSKCQRALDTPLLPGQEECAACSRETETPPSTWTLFRLLRFAKPYKGRLLAGFLLTLGSATVA